MNRRPLTAVLLLLFLGLSLASLCGQIKVSPNVSYEHTHILWTPSKTHMPTSATQLTRDEQLLIQIFLDEHNFGPGVLDGSIGGFTLKAVQAYYQHIGRSKSGNLSYVLERAFKHKKIPYATVTVPAVAKNYVLPSFPSKFSQMAKYKSSPYRSYLEFMAERYHTSEKMLIALNTRARMQALQPGDILLVPNVKPFKLESLQKAGFAARSSTAGNHAVITVESHSMHIYNSKGGVLAYFPITRGPTHRVRFGSWTVKNSVPNPSWRYDPKVLRGEGKSSPENVYIVPGGPNSPVGVIWNGLSTKSIGIHGTNSPETIGRARSSGCIRMANWDVMKFVKFIRPGCKVTIK